MSDMNHKQVKASSLGKTGTLKKDGYAKGGVPQAAQAHKPGTPYSGPNTASGKF